MGKKPNNLKKIAISKDGKSLYGTNPYVSFNADEVPAQITLDGKFGIEDLRWLLNWISTQKEEVKS